MNWFLDVIKNKYATFTGRARRQEFWMYMLFVLIIEVVIAIIGSFGDVLGTIMSVVMGIFGLAIIIPSLAVWIRRLHDSGKSGWWMLLGLTGIGSIVLFIFALLDSTPGDNKYGPNPKGL